MLPDVSDELAAVLFDAGGTLVHIDYDFIVEQAGKLGVQVRRDALELGEAQARRLIDERAKEHGTVEGTDASRIERYFVAVVAAAGLEGRVASEVVGSMLSEHARSNLWRVAFSDAADTLDGLRAAGKRTAVVSNADGRIRARLANLGLAQRVEFVLDSFEEGVEKPDAEIFHRAIRRLGIPPEATAYVGDIYCIDVVGARGAGLVPILVDPTGAYGNVDCRTVSSLSELLVVTQRPLASTGSGSSPP